MFHVHRPDDTERRMTSPRNPAEGRCAEVETRYTEMFMPISSKDVLVKLETITQAWSKLRPAKTFAGLTLEQFLAAIKPSYDVRAEIAESELHLQSGQARRVTIDEASLKIGQRIVNAVKADPEEGDDGEVYVAMGYVRKRDRKSGLTQRKREGKTAEGPSLEALRKDGAGQ